MDTVLTVGHTHLTPATHGRQTERVDQGGNVIKLQLFWRDDADSSASAWL